MIFFNFHLKLSKYEAPSCNVFLDTKFSMSKFAKDNNWKKMFCFFNIHQVIY